MNELSGLWFRWTSVVPPGHRERTFPCRHASVLMRDTPVAYEVLAANDIAVEEYITESGITLVERKTKRSR
jgi:hypothetical protein